MTSILPLWLVDISTLGSLLGTVISIVLLWEARKIRKSFLRRARLPEIIKELNLAHKSIAKHLKTWELEEKEGIQYFTIAKELLDNLKHKLPDTEKKKVSVYIQFLIERKWLFLTYTATEIPIEKAWQMYTELSGIITTLNQLKKDSKWD